jgi:hypothetical protein
MPRRGKSKGPASQLPNRYCISIACIWPLISLTVSICTYLYLRHKAYGNDWNAPCVGYSHLSLFANLPTSVGVISAVEAAAHPQINLTSCFESLAFR